MKQSTKPRMDPLGLYISVPFCRAKCSFCNFASDAFAPGRLPLYVRRLCQEIRDSSTRASQIGADLPSRVDTLYFGGGTPSLLQPTEVRAIFAALRDHFDLAPDAEITVECAPNQLSPETLEEFQRAGVNRLSFGVQSFIDRESAAIGRTHTAAECVRELDRVRSAGILNLSLDLIAGLPHQTEASWRSSVAQAIETGVPHISVYMLEVDEDSRLGREILTAGPRYGAASTPTDDDSATFYEIACDLLESAGIAQYEISNFARPGFRSAHNLKYWDRKPYLGLGLDAHSMLPTPSGPIRLANTVRFANTDDLDAYLASPGPKSREDLNILPAPSAAEVSPEYISSDQAFEETLFLGLRKVEGVPFDLLRQNFGQPAIDLLQPSLTELEEAGLATSDGLTLRLTPRGRVLSNEVFERLLLPVSA